MKKCELTFDKATVIKYYNTFVQRFQIWATDWSFSEANPDSINAHFLILSVHHRTRMARTQYGGTCINISSFQSASLSTIQTFISVTATGSDSCFRLFQPQSQSNWSHLSNMGKGAGEACLNWQESLDNFGFHCTPHAYLQGIFENLKIARGHCRGIFGGA